jgi:hypothetical protein
MATLVNGRTYDFANIQVSILGVTPKHVPAISYSQTTEQMNMYGIGHKPVAYGVGNDEFTASIDLAIEEYQAIIDAAFNAGIVNGDITKIAPFDIIVQFGAVGQPIKKHKLIKCRFANIAVSGATGESGFVETYELIPGDIDWNAQ